MTEIITYDARLKTAARENRRGQTPAERKMWYELLSKRDVVGYKFTRQKPLGHFIADFYCSKLRLVVEIDGDSHVDRTEYDEERTRRLEALGLRVIRYTNEEVMGDIDGVRRDLVGKIGEIVGA